MNSHTRVAKKQPKQRTKAPKTRVSTRKLHTTSPQRSDVTPLTESSHPLSASSPEQQEQSEQNKKGKYPYEKHVKKTKVFDTAAAYPRKFKPAKVGEIKLPDPHSRPHSVENMIKTQYIEPNSFPIQGATVSLDLQSYFDKDPKSTHICFVPKHYFGNSLTRDGDDADGEDDDSEDSDESEEQDNESNEESTTKIPKAKKPKKIFPINIAKLKATYPYVNWSQLPAALMAQGFSADAGQVAAVPNFHGSATLIVGLGKVDKKLKGLTPSTYRSAITSGIKAAMKIKSDNVLIKLPTQRVLKVEPVPTGYGLGVGSVTHRLEDDHNRMHPMEAITQGVHNIITTNYSFDAYLKQDTVKSKHHKIKKFTLINEYKTDGKTEELSITDRLFGEQNNNFPISPKFLHRALHQAESENFAKEIGSLRSNHKTNEYMKDQCEALVKAHPDVLKIKVLDKEELKKQGHNLILSVNQGSPTSPYIVGIEYNPVESATATTPESDVMDKKSKKDDRTKGSYVYVGKTLTFDTGGINVKNEACGIHHMSLDALGGCNTLALMRTLALTRPKTEKSIVGILTITDNLIGSHATRPSDIFHTPKGSVSIDHTDAEGRLALADGILFAQKQYFPRQITTMATLTGAVIGAVGHNTGIFSNNKYIGQHISATGDLFGEVFWPMPILKENHEAMEAKHTDLTNDNLSSKMGASTAAAFLEKFVDSKRVTFVHLDIAGSATDKDEVATGATIKTLQSIIEKH